mgnify:CR=1 FL=1
MGNSTTCPRDLVCDEDVKKGLIVSGDQFVSGLAANEEIKKNIEETKTKMEETLEQKEQMEKEIEILIGLNRGNAKSCAWGCDLTYDYVKINGDYRT